MTQEAVLNYYNDNDPKCCAWLRELIADGLIPAGEVSDNDVRDIDPSDLERYTQVHLFAGIGGWPLALRMADWPDDRPTWTGSCPCQPFSIAGKGGGTEDARHLWPAFRWLIAQRRPPTVFGEQVASKAGRAWLGGVRADLEAMGYAVGTADLCAAGVGAPHIRQRLWWLADGQRQGLEGHAGNERDRDEPGRHRPQEAGSTPTSSVVDWSRAVWWPCRDGKWRRVPARRMGDGQSMRRGEEPADSRGRNEGTGPEREPGRVGEYGADGGLADAEGHGRRERQPGQRQEGRTAAGRGSADDGLADTDGADAGAEREQRGGELGLESGDSREGPDTRHDRLEVEPALFPLADGVPGRVGLLRGTGNAIVPQVAAAFVSAFMETE